MAILSQSRFAIAQHINIHPQERIHPHQPSKYLQIGIIATQRLWWHTKAYGTVLGIILLIFASLGYVYIHWSGRIFLAIFKSLKHTN
jgi:hypothetical protein